MTLRLIGTAVVALLLLVGAFMAWLLWPVPEPTYDWQARAIELAPDADCDEIYFALLFGTYLDPADVETYLADTTFKDLCPDILGEDAIALEATIIEEATRGQDDLVSRMRDRGALVNNWQSWRHVRGARGNASIVAQFEDLAIAFRCDFQIGVSRGAFLVDVTGRLSNERPYMHIPRAWVRRAAQCAEMASRAAERIERTGLPRDGGDRNALHYRYTTYAEEWQALLEELVLSS